ncbi:Uncharacterised protein [Mycobacteroides abscessus subsp. abscessus]|nr:Uncharacterised protein [Mycobacteroides abscessus subsp. abscessus]
MPHQERASSLLAPSATVACTSSTAPLLIRSRITSSETPHSCWMRPSRSQGSSGRVPRSFSMSSALGATGSRSGSGKYR